MTTTADIINIQVTRESKGVTQQTFSIPLHVGTHAYFSDRFRIYSSIDAVGGDIPTTSDLYTQIQNIFKQNPTVTKVVVGRRAVDSVKLTLVGAPVVGKQYAVTINGIKVLYTATAATASSWSAGMMAAIRAVTPALTGFSISDDTQGTLTLAVTNADIFSIFPTTLTSVSFVSGTTENYIQAIDAIIQLTDQFYGVTIDTHTQEDVVAVAQHIEALKRTFATATNDPNAQSASATTDLGSVLKALGLTRTVTVFSDEADTEYPETAFMGKMLPLIPGSYTAMFKTLAGITADKFSATAVSNMKDKNYNLYEPVGGVNMLSEGVTSDGSFFDEIVLADWTEARIRERIFFRLVNLLKVPMTRAGAAIIESEIRAVWKEGVQNGGFSPDVAPYVYVPDPLTLDPNTRTKRVLDGVKFTFQLASGIHHVAITGTLVS